VGGRVNKGALDPNSINWSQDPFTDPNHKHTSKSVVGGSNSSASAVESAPTFVTTVAQALSATNDTMLYINVKTAATLGITFGPTTGAEYTLCASETVALGVITIRVPATWLVVITGTVADLGIIAVTC
jgi:uncharacterized membrane protein